MNERREILVVTVPAGSIKPDGFGKFREYVIESILRDVLVVDDTMKMSIAEVPAIGMPQVRVEVQVEEPKEEAPATNRLADTAQKLPNKEEKQAILQRLLDYRQRNGAGSLNDVARKTYGKSITPDVLRLLVTGDAVLTIAEWRAIGRALDKLEAAEQAVAEDG